jgi:hypothetical protein
MYAVEFEADTDKGFIKIPLEHPELMSKHLRVIVIGCEPLKNRGDLPPGFQNPTKISSYKAIAKRDEIYDR